MIQSWDFFFEFNYCYRISILEFFKQVCFRFKFVTWRFFFQSVNMSIIFYSFFVVEDLRKMFGFFREFYSFQVQRFVVEGRQVFFRFLLSYFIIGIWSFNKKIYYYYVLAFKKGLIVIFFVVVYNEEEDGIVLFNSYLEKVSFFLLK